MAQVGVVNPQPDSWVPTCVGETNLHLAIAEEFGSAKIGTADQIGQIGDDSFALEVGFCIGGFRADGTNLKKGLNFFRVVGNHPIQFEVEKDDILKSAWSQFMMDDERVSLYFETEELLELKLCLFANIVRAPKRLPRTVGLIEAAIVMCLDDIICVGGGIIKEKMRESKIESIASNTYEREPDNSEEYKKLRNDVAQRLGRWCADLDAAYAKHQQKLENTKKKKMAERKEKRRIKERLSFIKQPQQQEQTEKKLAFEQLEETEKKWASDLQRFADLDMGYYAKYQQKEKTKKKKMAETKEKRKRKDKLSSSKQEQQQEQTEKKFVSEQPEETEKKWASDKNIIRMTSLWY